MTGYPDDYLNAYLFPLVQLSLAGCTPALPASFSLNFAKLTIFFEFSAGDKIFCAGAGVSAPFFDVV